MRTRTRSWCQGSNNDGECSYDFVRRTIWNGEQTLGQIRMPDTDARREWDGFPTEEQRIGNFDPNPHLGQVIYTHGTGIDQPLSVMRMGYGDHVFGDNYRTWTPFAVFPLWDPEGGAPYAVFADGTREHCLPNSTRCLGSWWQLAWLPYAGDKNAFVRSGGIDGETVWLGNLMDDRQDASGLLYRWNRYYDPVTGRFTQEDPIGLAGGLNLYGFAGSDPVNFADPFGLCPFPVSSCVEAAERLQGQLIGAAVSALGAIGEVTGVSGLMRAFSGKDAAGNTVGTGARLFEGGIVVAGILGGAAGDLARAAAVADRGGFTLAGRALAKHGSRAGSAFELPKGNPAAINAAAQGIVEDILGNGTSGIRRHARFGNVLEIRDPAGRGLRYTDAGRFIGFLEP